MSRVLVVYWDQPAFKRETFTSHLRAYERFTPHDFLYLDVSRRAVPRYLRECKPDLVIFQNTFVMAAAGYEHDRVIQLVEFLKGVHCTKSLVASDEQLNSSRLIGLIDDFGISHIFTFAPPEARRIIYRGLRSTDVHFHSVLSGYVDEHLLKKIRKLERSTKVRTIDIGCRVAEWHLLGTVGQMKVRVADTFAKAAPSIGVSTDISRDVKDTLYGEDWLRFLLKCRYVLGCESGSSVLDEDGTVAECIYAYLSGHQEASFEEVRSACFADLDGAIDYRALAPRHLEAVMTRTCQILVEGDYSGVLRAGDHYIAVKQDFSNVEQVLSLVGDEELRLQITANAYRDIVESGHYSYRHFAEHVLDESLGPRPGLIGDSRLRSALLRCWNRIDGYCSAAHARLAAAGERRLSAIRCSVGKTVRHVLGDASAARWRSTFRGRHTVTLDDRLRDKSTAPSSRPPGPDMDQD